MNIAVIGAGYVGLVSGACFSELGAHVTCIDTDLKKIQQLELGKLPIYEPGLDIIIHQNVAAGRLHFTDKLAHAITQASVILLAVGTPTNAEDGRSTDLRYIFAAAQDIAPYLKKDAVIVTKSTVPVGTGAKIKAIIEQARPDLTFHVASNPEFLREGSAVDDFMEPDRIVIGTESAHAEHVLRSLYAPLIVKGAKFLNTSIKTAEIIKYAANSFLATKIAFINEMADICEAAGADVKQVADGMGLDTRIGRQFLNAGPGFGGSCFPKDIRSLHHISEQLGKESHIIKAVIHSNEMRKQNMVDKIIAAIENPSAVIAILGAAFKANTDDIRESPALEIAAGLLNKGYQLRLYDPEAMENAKAFLTHENVVYATSTDDAIAGANAIVIATEWEAFSGLDLAAYKHVPVIDLRNLYNLDDAQKAGLSYVSIGREAVAPMIAEGTDEYKLSYA